MLEKEMKQYFNELNEKNKEIIIMLANAMKIAQSK